MGPFAWRNLRVFVAPSEALLLSGTTCPAVLVTAYWHHVVVQSRLRSRTGGVNSLRSIPHRHRGFDLDIFSSGVFSKEAGEMWEGRGWPRFVGYRTRSLSNRSVVSAWPEMPSPAIARERTKERERERCLTIVYSVLRVTGPTVCAVQHLPHLAHHFKTVPAEANREFRLVQPAGPSTAGPTCTVQKTGPAAEIMVRGSEAGCTCANQGVGRGGLGHFLGAMHVAKDVCFSGTSVWAERCETAAAKRAGEAYGPIPGRSPPIDWPNPLS